MDRVMEGLTALAEFLADRYKEDPGSKHLQSIKRAEIEIERLRATVTKRDVNYGEERIAREAAEARIAELEASEKRMREALEFYAVVDDYKAPFTGGMGKLWSDCGLVARAALAKEGE